MLNPSQNMLICIFRETQLPLKYLTKLLTVKDGKSLYPYLRDSSDRCPLLTQSALIKEELMSTISWIKLLIKCKKKLNGNKRI